MKIVWATAALEDYHYWHATDRRIANKINRLIADIRRSPFKGIGKPEPLKNDWAGWWARRIDKEHRLVYRVVGKRGSDRRLEVAQCRYHY
jgi:toxin YoeB